MEAERYIDIAARVLRSLNRPASAREIVEAAKATSDLAMLVRGKTPHKTINARIAMDILKKGSESPFYRFAPAAYGLRELAQDGTYSAKYNSEYLAINRRKQVAKEDVAAIDLSKLSFMPHDGMYDGRAFPFSILHLLGVEYVNRKEAEARDDLKQLVSYAYLRHDDFLVAFERGSFVADGGEFIGKQSIAFGGHINDRDISLFDDDRIGLLTNIERELYEELSIFRNKLWALIDVISFKGFLVDSSTSNGRRHLGIVAEVRLTEKVPLENSGLGMRNLRWLSCKATPNCFDEFEIWSKYLWRFLQNENGEQA